MDLSAITVKNTAAGAWQGMIDDINAATELVIYEQYILASFEPDQAIGQQFINAFVAAANRGVDVRLMIDAQGSLAFIRNSDINQQLQNAGVEITFYRTMPLSRLVNPLRLFLRDHRKVLLIDDSITWIGGVVIGEEFRDWIDYSWRIKDNSLSISVQEELSSQYERIESGKKLLAPFAKAANEVYLVGNAPGIGNRHIYEQISQNVLLAEREVNLVTPYFAPPLRLQRVLAEKLRDQVQIKLFIPEKSDHAIANWARWYYLVKMENQGLEIYFCQKMNHAKVVTCDEFWATFGSANLDYLSLVFNHELNLDINDPELVALITSQIDDWSNSYYKKIDREYLHSTRPTWWQRAIGFIARPFV